MAVDSIVYSLKVGFWSGRSRRRRKEDGFNIKSNNPNLKGGENIYIYIYIILHIKFKCLTKN